MTARSTNGWIWDLTRQLVSVQSWVVVWTIVNAPILALLSAGLVTLNVRNQSGYSLSLCSTITTLNPLSSAVESFQNGRVLMLSAMSDTSEQLLPGILVAI